MTWVTVAVIGAGATLIGGSMQASAASDAAGAQSAAAQAGIDEQRRQFDAVQKLLAPYVQAGNTALGGLSPYAQAGAPALQQQMALAGLGGNQAQQAAINQIANSPLLQAQMRQGEQAMLQNASATGGLRGGNLQGALAQFRPQMLQQAITDQYGRLGGLTALGQTTTQNLAQLGQSSAAGTGSAAMTTGSNIANLMGQQGAAQAGGALGSAAGWQSAMMGIPSSMMMYSGMTGQPMFGAPVAQPGVITGGTGLKF